MKDRVHRVATAQRLREVMSYDLATGEFQWKIRTGYRVQVGANAGCLGSEGYWIVSLDGISYRRARLAWLYVTGDWPKGEVDHIDRRRSNDRWENLREVTSAQNKENTHRMSNNTSGYRGVSFHRPSGKWRARVTVSGVDHCGRYWSTAEEAKTERDEMRAALGVREALDASRPDLIERHQIESGFYAETLAKQHGCCAACKRPWFPSDDAALAFDVDPATGELCSLLCRECKEIVDFADKHPAVIGSLSLAQLYLQADSPRWTGYRQPLIPQKESA